MTFFGIQVRGYLSIGPRRALSKCGWALGAVSGRAVYVLRARTQFDHTAPPSQGRPRRATTMCSARRGL
eukprot:scaffold46134_cov64-Phaeocystis_antarctica.AAC.2